MEILFFIFYNFFGSFSKSITALLPCILAFTMSTSAEAFPRTQETTPVEEQEKSDELNDFEVCLKPVFLKKDLLPEMTMTFAMGKNGEVLFVSSYDRDSLKLSGKLSKNIEELFFNKILGSN